MPEKTEEVKNLAERLAERYMKTSPPHRAEVVLPACYYLAYIAKGRYITKGKRMTQGEIARTYGISTVTLRKVYKDVIKKVGAIGDKDYDEFREVEINSM